MPDSRPVPITDCDREPIHIPGQIQPFGLLLACSQDGWIITHVSANAAEALGVRDAMLGASLKEVIGREAFHAIANALAASSGPALPGRVFDMEFAGSRYNIAIHANAGSIIVELEQASTRYEPSAPLVLVRSMMARMQQAHNVEDMCAIAVRQVRALIEFDRVMVYRFLQDGSGQVVAESCADGVTSFLDHHYPASDIPQQARALYVKNWLRLIADVRAEPVPVLSAPTVIVPLDMTYSNLRSVSPVHIEYLKNMDVAASLSISIVTGEALWGLIACHNLTPRVVPADTRVAAEFFGQAFSLQLQTLVRADVAELLRDARDRIDRIVSELPLGVTLSDSLGVKLDEIRTILPCDGVALWFDGRLTRVGSCPPDDEIPRVADALTAGGHSTIFATNELSAFYPPAVAYAFEASGLLSVQLSRHPGHYLLLFRREIVRTINWAGDPVKAVDRDDAAPRLSPRKSFEIWRQEVKNQSQIWESHDRLTAEALRISLLEIVLKHTEIVAQERAKADALQRLHMAEFNHRAKNALALVGALVAQSKGQHNDMRSFVADLEGRIRSIALAHDLASKPGLLDLRRLLEIELQAFEDGRGARFVLTGPPVNLLRAAAGVMALVVHELATNASKYGALSVAQGSVSVDWRLKRNGGCSITWRERGGPPVSKPAETGFGAFLIRNQIPFELGGRVAVTYAPAGLEVRLSLPSDSVAPGDAPVVRSAVARAQSPAPRPRLLAGMNVLLVEDSLIVALEIERALRRLGAADVFVFGTLEQAVQFAETLPIGVAVLDINLKGATSYPVADILVRRGIPFVFATGYGVDCDRAERFAAVPVIGKPYGDADLSTAISEVIVGRDVTGRDG